MRPKIEYTHKKALFLGVLNKHYFQKDLLNITRKVKNSNLPANIPKERTHLANSGISAKLYDGPIILPKPGPTLDIEVADAEIEVSISRPVKDKIRAIITKVTKKIKRKVITDSTISRVKFSPL